MNKNQSHTEKRSGNAFLLRMISFPAIMILLSMIILSSCGGPSEKETVDKSATSAGAASLVLPDGFSAAIVADSLGKARHIAVTSKGDIYVKLAGVKDGKGIIFLHDTNGDGTADERTGFGNYGGTGIYIKNDYLYASSNEEVYRYALDNDGKVKDTNQVEKIVTGLIDRNQHNTKSLVLDNDGNIYVNIGAYSNACQEQDRTDGSPGMQPCPILDSAGGIWMFKANQLNQSYDNGVRYATGLRNVVGLDWNSEKNQLFVMPHGRDMLFQLYPKFFDEKQGAELPSETLYAIKKGDDAGWPYIYYDHLQNKKILAPEYGGDGKKTSGEKVIDPVATFPGHMAPNGLLFYTGNMFPDRYKNGAFIAFHGSWNRSPEPQKGYFVAFVPFSDGKPSGEWETFADNFAGAETIKSPGDALRRPCGLAQGPDGSLYVSDDVKGTIYRITYKGK
ncbi:MAG: PQQ-dependent sugar dehydrogenase [Chitinophagaceae bacterium]